MSLRALKLSRTPTTSADALSDTWAATPSRRNEAEVCLMERRQLIVRHTVVLLLDLDHFKQVNDSFGHDAGDYVLRSIADLFRNSFRGSDIYCRYGGEEFAVLLPGASAENAIWRHRLSVRQS